MSSSHGEAWCLPAYEAKVAGNAMVHVPYGGTADFAAASDVAVPFRLGPVHTGYGWEPGARWADYHIADLSAALRAARAPARYERPVGFAERFSFDSVGREMARHVLELLDRTQRKAADSFRSAAYLGNRA